MSLRKYFPSKTIDSTSCFDFFRAPSRSLSKAVAHITRPPFVTTFPSWDLVPEWKSSVSFFNLPHFVYSWEICWHGLNENNCSKKSAGGLFDLQYNPLCDCCGISRTDCGFCAHGDILFHVYHVSDHFRTWSEKPRRSNQKSIIFYHYVDSRRSAYASYYGINIK